MRQYTTVLLDVDNTLMDFDATERVALERTMVQNDLPYHPDSEAQYHAINHRLWTALDRGDVERDFLVVERFRLFFQVLGQERDPVAFNRDYLTYLGMGNQLLPGALALCRDLSPHYRLALATNGVARVQHARLETSPLLEYFPHVFISEEIGYSKPHKGFFDVISREMNLLDPKSVLMVGDTLGSDILGGQTAGMDTLWYNPKGNPPQEGIAPTYTVTDFEGIRSILLP